MHTFNSRGRRAMKKKILILGTSLTQADQDSGEIFSGLTGSILFPMLSRVGIDKRDCHFANVINQVSDGYGFDSFCTTNKADGIKDRTYLARGKYLHKKYQPELDRLAREIEEVNPNIIIALGALPLWALTRSAALKKFRGTPLLNYEGTHKIIATWEPLQIMRQWKLRVVAVSDLDKAARQSKFPELRRPQRYLHLDPTLEEIEEFYHTYIVPAPFLSTDIETAALTVTEVGFATSATRAIVIPFYDKAKPNGNYWSTFEEEKQAWYWVRKIWTEKLHVGQNFSYDMKYMWQMMGIPTPRLLGDTMLLHHSLQPELEKGLGFLASLYTDEPSWKFMRADAKSKTAKKED